MTTTTCAAAGCGRIHGCNRPHGLCDYHRHDIAAGVEVRLSTGYVLWLDHEGMMHARKPRVCGKMAVTEDRNGPAVLEAPEAVAPSVGALDA